MSSTQDDGYTIQARNSTARTGMRPSQFSTTNIAYNFKRRSATGKCIENSLYPKQQHNEKEQVSRR